MTALGASLGFRETCSLLGSASEYPRTEIYAPTLHLAAAGRWLAHLGCCPGKGSQQHTPGLARGGLTQHAGAKQPLPAPGSHSITFWSYAIPQTEGRGGQKEGYQTQNPSTVKPLLPRGHPGTSALRWKIQMYKGEALVLGLGRSLLSILQGRWCWGHRAPKSSAQSKIQTHRQAEKHRQSSPESPLHRSVPAILTPTRSTPCRHRSERSFAPRCLHRCCQKACLRQQKLPQTSTCPAQQLLFYLILFLTDTK